MIKEVKPTLLATTFILGLTFWPKVAWAQPTCTRPGQTGCIPAQLQNPVLPSELQALSGFQFIQRLITTAIGVGVIVGIVLFFFLLLIGAIRWITAGGDKGQIESAGKTITNALIGLAILLSIFAIIQLIGHFFDLDLLNIKIPYLVEP